MKELQELLKKQYEPGLLSLEWITILYVIYTTILILFYWNGLNAPTGMLLTRAGVLVGIGIIYTIYKRFPYRILRVARIVPMMVLLIIWYPENYDFCSQLPYLDHIFAGIDHSIFGFQPALEFSKAVDSTFWCEAFNLGYYAYYYMMAATMLFYYVCRYDRADKAGFIFLGSFFTFYVIYQFLPVAGPQYYFKAVGEEAATLGVFPEVGNYFRTHLECIPLDVRGIFSSLVLSAQEAGECPTAAFPSSHVGMSTVTMILAYRSGNKPLFFIMLPLYLLLCCATVYIKAHYFIDSLVGFIFACFIYWVMYKTYDKLMNTPYRKLICNS